MAHGARGAKGLTLIELLTTLAVLTVTLTIGVPAFADMAQRVREANAYHLLTASMATARMAAVKNGTPVTVCPSSDGGTCRGDPIWEHGWIIYSDPERDEQPASAAAVLQHLDDVGPGLALRSTQGRVRVRFTPNGWAYGSNLSIRLCETEGARLLGKVVVNNGGRPRSERREGVEPCPYMP